MLDAVAAPAPATANTVAATPAAAPRARYRLAAGAAFAAALVVATGAGVLALGIIASSYWRGQAKAALAIGPGRQPDAEAGLAFLERAARAPRLDSVRFDIALRTAQAALQAGHGGEAFQAANRALALEPYSPHAWATRAAAQMSGELNDPRGARDDAERALHLFADLPAARAARDKASAVLRPDAVLDASAPHAASHL